MDPSKSIKKVNTDSVNGSKILNSRMRSSCPVMPV